MWRIKALKAHQRRHRRIKFRGTFLKFHYFDGISSSQHARHSDCLNHIPGSERNWMNAIKMGNEILTLIVVLSSSSFPANIIFT
jgi:hypothetical protein